MGIIKDAAKFAEQVHNGEFRRDGKTPYFIHVQRVADLVESVGGSKTQIAIAYLHDSIENHPERSSLAKEIEDQFGKEVLEGVVFLTKEKPQDYEKYVEHLKTNKEALLVKVCDMVDNLSDNPTSKQKTKYARAIMKLID